MQSLGNDFVMVNGVQHDRAHHIKISPQMAIAIADRHFGIGCDQILWVEPKPAHAKAVDEPDYGVRIFNRDGSEVGQCGNGARCLAIFLRDEGLMTSTTAVVRTITRTLQLKIHPDDTVTADLGAPIFTPEQIPLAIAQPADRYQVDLPGAAGETHTVDFFALSVGNPHCVIRVADTAQAAVTHIGAAMTAHALLPEGANIGFAEHVSRTAIKLRVYERGAGETLGCGSGAGAAAVAGIYHGLLDSPVAVTLPGGTVTIHWDGGDAPVYCTSAVARVFTGEMKLQ